MLGFYPGNFSGWLPRIENVVRACGQGSGMKAYSIILIIEKFYVVL